MLINLDSRSEEIEIMDDLEMEGHELEQSLKILDKINFLLGGNRITINGVKKLLDNIPTNRPLRIIDLGCGSGDMLCQLAKIFNSSGRKIEFIGLDANPNIVKLADSWSKEFPNVYYKQMLIPSAEFEQLEFDIALSTLFLHHFKDKELIPLVENISKKAAIGIVINDLQRNYLAYFLFYLISRFIPNRMIKEDGLTSVSRGFRKKELVDYSKKLKLKSEINWYWAFRYQWIIRTA